MISWIQVIQSIEGFATAHLQVRKYGAEALEQLDQFATRDGLYPLLYLYPIDQVIQRDCVEMTYGAICLDRLNKNRDNANVLKSDCALILSDLTRWLDENFEVNYGSIVEFKNNDTVDYCAGAEVRITMVIEKVSDCEIPFDGSPFPPTPTCEPATVIVLNSDGTQVDGGTVVSGGTGTFEAPDATAVLKDTAGTVLSTTAIPSDTSENIVAPDANLSINGQPTYVIPSGGFINEMVENTQGTPVGAFDPNSASWVVGDAGYTLDNSEGSTLFSGSIPAEDGDTIIAPDGQAVNSNASFTLSVPSGGTAPIPDTTFDVFINGVFNTTFNQPTLDVNVININVN
jgi:hypothetical protein